MKARSSAELGSVSESALSGRSQAAAKKSGSRPKNSMNASSATDGLATPGGRGGSRAVPSTNPA
jgi:hypothetical protein